MIVIRFFHNYHSGNDVFHVLTPEQEPTVDEIISALRIVRKFSQKNNLIKEIESLRSIEKKCQAEQLANKRQQSFTSFLL